MRVTFWLPALLLAVGCTTPQVAQPLPPPSAAAAVAATTPSGEATAAPTEQIGTYAFGPVTAAQLIAAGPTSFGSRYSLRARPDIRPETSRARRMESGNYEVTYAFRPPFPEEGLIVKHVLAAELGTPLADVAAWLSPLRQAWAADAILMSAYDYQGPRFAPSEGFDPSATKDEASILRNAGWPLCYTSASKREALYVYASGLVFKVGWQAADFAAEKAPIGPAEAVQRYDAAMRDPAALSLEGQTGHDHFLGFAYANAYPADAWFPANVHDDDTPVFDFPKTTAWEAQFRYEFAGKPVWYVGVPTGSGYGGGLVDAITGEVVRFFRVTRRYSPGRGAPGPMALPTP